MNGCSFCLYLFKGNVMKNKLLVFFLYALYFFLLPVLFFLYFSMLIDMLLRSEEKKENDGHI